MYILYVYTINFSRRDCSGWCDWQWLLETVAFWGQASDEGQAGISGTKGGHSGGTGHCQEELRMGGWES